MVILIVMDDQFRGFDGEVYTLNIGPEKKALRVPEGILTSIPYFKTAMSSGSFTETNTMTFDLPEDDPQAVADILYYTYTRNVRPLKIPHHQLMYDCESTAAVEAHLRAYIVADKYKAEDTANSLVDEFINFQSESRANPGYLPILSEAGLVDSPIYKLIVREVLFHILDRDYRDRLILFDAADAQPSTFEEMVRRLPHEDLVQLTLMANDFKDEYAHDDKDQIEYPTLSDVGKEEFPSSKALENLCKYHKHDLTDPCSK